MKMKNILLIALSTFAPLAQAQDIAQRTIAWGVSMSQDMAGGQPSSEQAVLTTFGKTRAELKGQDGSLRWALEVVEAVGAWGNVGSTGGITYEVRGTEGNGTLTFQKDATGTKARLLLVKDAGPQIWEYTLSNHTVL